MVARRYEIYLRVLNSINFISPNNHVLFCLFYKPTNNKVFDDFPKISDNFPKISEDFVNVVRLSYECFRTFSENFRRFPINLGPLSIVTWQTVS